MDLSLQFKVALVTGSGSGRGLGRSIVGGLTQAGAHAVVTAAREIEKIERAASEAPRAVFERFESRGDSLGS